MLKVVLDNDVLVSGLINPHGTPAKILNHTLKNRIRLSTSPSMIEEQERILSYPKLVKRHGLPKEELEEFLAGLLITTSLIEKEPTIKVLKESPRGNTYLSCALNGRADFIITEDEHLLNLGEYQGIQIISPARFLDIMEREL